MGGRVDSGDSLYLRCWRMIGVSEYTNFQDWTFCHLDEIETLLYILNNSLLFSCFSKSSTSHYFFPISSMINLAIWKSLSITLFIIKTSEYMTQNIGKILMTLIGLSLLKCTQSVNKYWRICQTVLINIEVASSVPRVMSLWGNGKSPQRMLRGNAGEP